MSGSKPQQAEDYVKYSRRRARAWWVVTLALALLVIFHNPQAWADGRIASWLNYASRAALLVAALVAYRANGEARELLGFCRGRYRDSPEALTETGK